MDESQPGQTKATIMVVDDTPANLRLLTETLTLHNYRVRPVVNGTMALKIAAGTLPDLILLDINMPDLKGYEVCERLKADENTRDIPIIFISALDEITDKVRAFQVGGVDYVTKPFQFQEILARVATHLTLRRLQKRLQEQNTLLEAQNSELDAFAHTVAHDLKNPLGVVIGYTELLLSDYDELSKEELREIAEGTHENARKSVDIINNLLLLASAHKMQITTEPVDMESVVREALSRLKNMIHQYDAQITVNTDWPLVLGYYPWIEEVWVNYLSNAMKYGGTPPQIELGSEIPTDNPQQIKFWVRDYGKGLTPEEISRLFAPFEQLGKLRAGSHGLGLSIVRRIVERLNGQVGVESTPGMGCTFYFTLPAVE